MLTGTAATAAGLPAAEIHAHGMAVDARAPSPAPGSAPTAPNPHAAAAPAPGTYIAPARRVPPPPPAVAPRVPDTPSAVHEFAVQDGGPAVFRRRIRNSAFRTALITAVLCIWTALIGQLLGGVLLSAIAILFGFLPRLLGALPLLVRSSLRIDAHVLQMRLGGTAFTVPWQDVALVSVTRAGNTLRLAVVLRSDAKRPVPAPLRRPGADDDREAEFLLISWNDRQQSAGGHQPPDTLPQVHEGPLPPTAPAADRAGQGPTLAVRRFGGECPRPHGNRTG